MSRVLHKKASQIFVISVQTLHYWAHGHFFARYAIILCSLPFYLACFRSLRRIVREQIFERNTTSNLPM